MGNSALGPAGDNTLVKTPPHRAMPVGAEVQPGGGVHFRVWAANARSVSVRVDGADHLLDAERDAYFSGHVAAARDGSRYGYRIDGGGKILADPASRFQPEGPHGLSCVIDPSSYAWHDGGWRGITLPRQVIYELHVGTFTSQGTWRAAADKLSHLTDLGVSVIEMMPVSDFPGRFGWGYDGVSLFAPTRLYGAPDDLRDFIDRAHQAGIGVILDVVYNHLGPDGNVLPNFSSAYFTGRYANEWGEAINFDGPGSAPVREFMRANAAYWVREFHFDGLRLDATQQIFDSSSEHIVAAVTRDVREAAGSRATLVIAENEPQDTKLVRSPEAGGLGLDALWNDDFHHAAHVALTGHNEAYYSDYSGHARELLASVRHGFLYQGQRSAWQNKRRGSPSLDLDPARLITFLENHDQVANSGRGARLPFLTDAGSLRAMTALFLLAPATPMLFQGQEFASSKPFLYFADHNAQLSAAVAKGRRDFLMQFPSLADAELADPGGEDTFRACILDWSERDSHAGALRLHKDLIRLRRTDPVFRLQGESRLDGAVLSDSAFVLRFRGPPGERLLLVNFGADFSPSIVPEPLLAPPEDSSWRLLWSSEHPDYNGLGARHPETHGRWSIPGHATVVLASQ